MVYAYQATDAGDFFLSAGRFSGEKEVEVLPLVRKISLYIQKYDTPTLFHRFGRKKFKDERDFLRRVEENYIREEIRPYIEKYVALVLDELVDAGFPLFLKGGRLDNFYKSQRLFLQAVPVRAILRFERTAEVTRYILRLTDGKRIFFPSDYDLKILTRRPCRVWTGRQLLHFPEDFDGQRLLPFLKKREILIPKANEQEYFRKFILKNVRYEEIEVQGFEVIVREVEKKAVLSLEQEVFALPVLGLEFYYGNQHIPAWSERKALVELRTEGDHYAFYKVLRDFEWEKQQKEQLLALGLISHAPGCFRAEGVEAWPESSDEDSEGIRNVSEQQAGESWQKTVNWLRIHREQLERKGIGITQQALRKKYYLGEGHLSYEMEEDTDWFELKAEVVLSDGRRIPFIRFRDAVLSGKREYLLDDGSVFFIPEEWFVKYTEVFLLAGIRRNSLFFSKSQSVLLEAFPKIKLPSVSAPADEEEISLPDGIRADLRAYQKIGYGWMYRLFRKRLGGCLADDMGLGKTLQTIALLLKYRQETANSQKQVTLLETGAQLSLFDTVEKQTEEKNGKTETVFHTCLVVVPASLIHNWRNELKKFAPLLRITVYAGQNRMDLRPFLQTSDVVLVTYHTLRNDVDYLSRLTFGLVVADEAQNLKNPGSQLYQAILRIQGICFFALSGTPVENSLSDLWAVMNFVNRNVVGSHHFFRLHFIRPILTDKNGQMGVILKRLIAPYILRRTKEEVLAELPDLTSELILCEPEEEQWKYYEEEQSKVRNYILDRRESQEGLRNDFMVLKALIRLRQIANHPRLVDVAYKYGSGKFREVFRMLHEVIGAGHKVLVFSSFVKYLQMVEEEVKQCGWKYAMLTGMTREREEVIRRFSADQECRLFLISLKAGGVGLNLTEAGYVFILDPWWNLAAENQAIGRAHRLGQKQAVFVYRFITAGTLEEKILRIQQRKQQLADTVISVSSPMPLNDEELLEALE